MSLKRTIKRLQRNDPSLNRVDREEYQLNDKLGVSIVKALVMNNTLSYLSLDYTDIGDKTE